MTNPHDLPNPVNTHRILRNLITRAGICEAYFMQVDHEYARPDANAAYIALQAKEYHEAIQQLTNATPEDRAAYQAHARSEASRILAILIRESISWGWNILDAMADGVEYEEAVIADIVAGRRGRKSHRAYGDSTKPDQTT